MTGKRPLLVLFTNYFPYFRGEEYLETELPYLTERFERVVVVPAMHEPSMERTREVPPGVEVVTVDMPSDKKARVLHTLTHAVPAYRQGRMRGTASPTNPVRHAFDLYFTTRGMEFWRRARPAVLRAVGNERDVAIYSYWMFVTAFAALELRKDLGDRARVVVSRAHGYDINVKANRLGFLPQRRMLVEGLDAVHPVSEAGADVLRATVPDLAHKVTVRRLGVTAPTSVGPRANRPRLELVSCSSLKPVKRMHLIVEALGLLAQRGVPFHWTHLGGAGEQVEALRASAGAVMPDESFTLAGHVANADVLHHYATQPVSVFVNVSSSEGVPVSIAEAMAHGVPALATRAGGTAELVTDGHDGWTLPVETDAAAIADALQRVWKLDEAEYARYSENARQTWAGDWAADKVYRAFADELGQEPAGASEGHA